MRRAIAIAASRPLLGVLAVCALGCRTECAVDGAEPPREQLAREQKAVLRGQATCLELLRPKLAVTDDRVLLTAVRDNVIASRAALPPKEVKRVEALFERLERYRVHYKQVRPADPFEPTIYVTLDPAIEPARAASLLMTAAVAGYARARVYVGGVELDALWWTRPRAPARSEEVPPTAGRHSGSTTEPVALCVDPLPSGGFDLRFEGRDAPSRAASLEALPREIAIACPFASSPCANVVGIGSRDGATLADVVTIIQAVLGSEPFAKNPNKPALLLETSAPMTGEWATSASLRPPCRR